METIIPIVVFALHSMAFAYFYFARGHRLYNLLFLIGFLFLLVFHVGQGWDFFTGEEGSFDSLYYFSWVGLAICAVATPFFVAHLFQAIRDRRRKRNQ